MIYKGILAAWAALCWLWRVVVGWPPESLGDTTPDGHVAAVDPPDGLMFTESSTVAVVGAECDDDDGDWTEWMTAAEAAAVIGCSDRTIRALSDGSAMRRRQETRRERDTRIARDGIRGGRAAYLYAWRTDDPPRIDRSKQAASLASLSQRPAAYSNKREPTAAERGGLTLSRRTYGGAVDLHWTGGKWRARIIGEARACKHCGAEMRSEDHWPSKWRGGADRQPLTYCSKQCAGIVSGKSPKRAGMGRANLDAPDIVTPQQRPSGGWMTLPQAASRLRISRHAVIDRAQRGHLATKTVNGVTVYADVRVTR